VRDPRVTKLADGERDLVPHASRRQLSHHLGIAIRARRFDQLVREVMTLDHGNRWSPVRAGRIHLGPLHLVRPVCDGEHDPVWIRRRYAARLSRDQRRWFEAWCAMALTPSAAFRFVRRGMRPMMGGSPGVLATDNFDRANAADLGANWTTQTGYATFGINTNACDSTSAGLNCGNWYSAISWPSDQYSQITLSATVAANSDAATVRAASAATTFYAGGHNNGDAGNFSRRIWKLVAGAFTSLGTEAVNIVASDIIRLDVQGSNLELKVNGVSSITVTDAAIASGNAGISANHSAVDVPLLDDFEGGDFEPSPPPGAPTLPASPVQSGLRW
jgi:hypothetical protein